MLTSEGTLILNLGPRPLKISHIGILSETFITNNEQCYIKIWIRDISGFYQNMDSGYKWIFFYIWMHVCLGIWLLYFDYPRAVKISSTP